MKTRVLAFVLAIASLAAPASAQWAVFDFSNWVKNTLSEQHNYATAINTARTVVQNITMIQNQIAQLKTLQANLSNSSWLWGQIQNQIQALNGILAQDSTFAQTDSALNDNFNLEYGYTPPANFDALYDKWNTNTHDAMLAAARAARLVTTSNANGALQVQLTNRKALATATGVHDTLQAIGKMADQQIEQISKLSQLDAARTSMEVQYYSAEIAKQNHDHATNEALKQWMNVTPKDLQKLPQHVAF
jgi:P-type conjugative transfer protein TrbJ